MGRLKISLFLGTVLVLALVVACAPKSTPTPTPTPTPAPTPTSTPKPESAADFYKKNTVEFIVPSGAGGGTDLSARTFASFWPDAAGGTAKVTNKTGAGQIAGNNYVYTVAKPDGLTIAFPQLSSMLEAVRGNVSGIEYDMTKLQYLGQFASSGKDALVVGPKSPYKSMADLQKVKGLKIGLEGLGSGYSVSTAVGIKVFSLDAKVIIGYAGSAEVFLALGRGEVDAATTDFRNYPRYKEQGLAGPALVVVDYERHDYWKDVPAIPELVNLTAEQRGFLDVHAKQDFGGRVAWVRPEVSKDKVAFLRDVFMKIVTNKDAVEVFKKHIDNWTTPMTGEEINKVILDILAQPKEYRDKVMQLLQQLAVK